MSGARLVVSHRKGWERAALLDGDDVVEMAVDAPCHETDPAPGAIVLGRVRAVRGDLNAAFVDIGAERDGFLSRDDCAGRTLSEGEAVVVQVQSPPVDAKGAKLTLRVAVAGRTAVFIPGGDRVATSARLQGDGAVLLETAKAAIGDGNGGIVRTAAGLEGGGRLTEELGWLRASWDRVSEVLESATAPAVVRPSDSAARRLLRDMPEVPDRIIVDDGAARSALAAWAAVAWPQITARIEHWNRPGDLFAAESVDAAVEAALAHEIDLPSGGRLTVERTRAAVAVDVDMARAEGRGAAGGRLAVNVEAAQAIARVVRARNLSGLIVVDFLKLKARKDRDAVLRTLERTSLDDPAGLRVGGFTPFGLVEMTRARRGPVLDDVLAAYDAASDTTTGERR